MTQEETVKGIVTESLPNTEFRIQLPSGDIMLCYLSGKMRIHRVRVLIGDSVEVFKDSYGGKGRIIRRL
jgi:translation initiation factor IF-1